MKINQNGERCSNNIDRSKKERVQRGVIIRTNWNKWRLICISLRSRCAFTARSFHLPRFYRYYDVMAFRYCHSFPLRERIHEDERRQARFLRLLILPNSFSLRRKLNWTRTWAFFFYTSRWSFAFKSVVFFSFIPRTLFHCCNKFYLRGENQSLTRVNYLASIRNL